MFLSYVHSRRHVSIVIITAKREPLGGYLAKYWNVKALKVRYTHIQTYVQRKRKSLYFKDR